MSSVPLTKMRQPAPVNWGLLAAAALLLVGGGLGYRGLAAHYARYNSSIPIPAGTLARLGLQLGDWRGSDSPLSQNVIQATDTDDRINRVYEQAGTFQSVSMFVGYGVRLRDLQPHRPEVCYPGAGWTMLERELATVKLSDGSNLRCQVHRFRRGGLSTQHITVLNYYIVDGEYWPDVGQLRKRAAAGKSEGHYVAQVQIACMDSTKPEPAREAVESFAAVSTPQILKLIESEVIATRTRVAGVTSRPSPQKSSGMVEEGA